MKESTGYTLFGILFLIVAKLSPEPTWFCVLLYIVTLVNLTAGLFVMLQERRERIRRTARRRGVSAPL